ncbi:MAG TPA: allantoinase AllB [Acidimicrobiia bacterium]|nr:allantoinase AllB [Acidimicrobiia bacterium]
MPSLRSRLVVTGEGLRPVTVRWEDGYIVDLGDGPAEHDFGDLAVLPGLVDTHVHVNEPGRTEWEGFATATRAALAGGTTTIVDMPLNSIPPTTSLDALQAKRRSADGKIVVDIAFWGGIVPGSLDAVPDLVDAGVCGFKVFLTDSGVPEFPPVAIDVLSELTLDVPLLVHAEADDVLGIPGPTYPEYLASRPAIAEAEAIRRLGAVDAPVHILHVSSADAVEAISAGQGISGETCPHYLTFTDEDVTSTLFKCAPPIREAQHREALWEGLRSRVLTMVVSDHSPSPSDLKAGDFANAWGGIASLELRLPATWTGARKRGFGLEDLARWLSLAPATLAGLDGSKGSIEVGKDADFVIFDVEGETVVDPSRLLQRHPSTPYQGMRLEGRVVDTIKGAPARMLTRP